MDVDAVPPIKEESSTTTVVPASKTSKPGNSNPSSSGVLPVGEARLSHPLLSLINSLPSPPLPAAALPSPPSQRFVAALTRLVGESNIDPAFPIATQPAKYLDKLASATPSRSAILYGTVITETLLNRAGPSISPGSLYRCLLAHFPTNETLWTKYLVEAIRMNRDVFPQLCAMLGVSTTTQVRDKGLAEKKKRPRRKRKGANYKLTQQPRSPARSVGACSSTTCGCRTSRTACLASRTVPSASTQAGCPTTPSHGSATCTCSRRRGRGTACPGPER